VQTIGQNPDPMSGIMGRNIDSRAATAPSNVGQQQQQQQGAGARRIFEVVEAPADRHDDAPDDYYISDLYNQLTQVIVAKPCEIDPLRIGDFYFECYLKI
jgi:hypothetical protein